MVVISPAVSLLSEADSAKISGLFDDYKSEETIGNDISAYCGNVAETAAQTLSDNIRIDLCGKISLEEKDIDVSCSVLYDKGFNLENIEVKIKTVTALLRTDAIKEYMKSNFKDFKWSVTEDLV